MDVTVVGSVEVTSVAETDVTFLIVVVLSQPVLLLYHSLEQEVVEQAVEGQELSSSQALVSAHSPYGFTIIVHLQQSLSQYPLQ